jgi:hypothetical protein
MSFDGHFFQLSVSSQQSSVFLEQLTVYCLLLTVHCYKLQHHNLRTVKFRQLGWEFYFFSASIGAGETELVRNGTGAKVLVFGREKRNLSNLSGYSEFRYSL